MIVIELKWLSLISILGSIIGVALPGAHADTALRAFTQEVERDISLKQQVPLTLIHEVGEVSVQGWVQDRIRVKLKKKVIAENQQQADQLFRETDLLTLETPRAFEMRTGVGRGKDLVTKLREREKNTVQVDLEIKAPYQLDLALILGKNQKFNIQQWKGALTVNSRDSLGSLSKLNLKGPIQMSCLGCDLEIADSHLDGHLLASTKSVVLRNVETHSLLVDTSSGEVKMENTRGKFMVHTDSGKLLSQNHEGELSFQSESGGIFLTGTRGKIEAQTNTGQMILEIDEVDHLLNLDSQKGDIQISLFSSFEGKLDLSSLKGEVVVQFPVEAIKSRSEVVYGPPSPGRVNATVGNRSGVVIHAETKQGGIRVLRRDPQVISK